MKILMLSFLGLTSLGAAIAPGDLTDVPARLLRSASLQALSAEEPVYVTAPVVRQIVAKTIMATGTLNTTRNVEVGSQLSGLIDAVNVDFNDVVRRGQVLAQLDARSYRAAADESEAALRSAQAAVDLAALNLERARITAEDAQLQKAVLDARVERAAADLDATTADAMRKQLLSRKGSGSVMDAINAMDRRKSAAAAYSEALAIRRAQDNIALGARKDVERAQAEVTAANIGVGKAQAQLREAQADLDRTMIRSPIDGVIIGRSIDPGETLATSLQTKTMFVVAGDLHEMDIYSRIDESDIGHVRRGQDAAFTVDAFPGRQFRATVRQIREDPVVVQNVVTYTVLLATKNDDLTLLPGMTALATILVSEPQPVLEVPTAALRFSPRLANAGSSPSAAPHVWIQDEQGRAKPVDVVIGELDGAKVAVRADGLREGSPVIIDETERPRFTDRLRTARFF